MNQLAADLAAMRATNAELAADNERLAALAADLRDDLAATRERERQERRHAIRAEYAAKAGHHRTRFQLP